jgi:hypothetical protein
LPVTPAVGLQSRYHNEYRITQMTNHDEANNKRVEKPGYDWSHSMWENSISLQIPPDGDDRIALRKWWHDILRNHGRYECYVLFLVLPSDKEAIQYLKESGRELDLLSGSNCALITLSNEKSKLPGSYEKFDDEMWGELIAEHFTDGYCVRVARLLGIGFTEFPCLVIFQNIYSENQVALTLKDMTSDEIEKKIRSVFSTINKAISEKQNPVVSIKSLQMTEGVRNVGKSVVSEIGNLTQKTLETLIEALIKANVR